MYRFGVLAFLSLSLTFGGCDCGADGGENVDGGQGGDGGEGGDASPQDVDGGADGGMDEDAGDVADGGADSSTDAALPRCGDGVVDIGETCDDGDDNSDTVVDACRTSCREASCGDGVVDTGETCDDGGGNSDVFANACRSTCVPATCGDGVVDSGESCDDGAGNSDTGVDACRTTCALASCGDGVVDAGEECDDGDDNDDDAADACRTTCTAHRCGDGVLDTGEACDDGAGNSDTEIDACRTYCVAASCGDGVLDTGEACDDDNADPNDGCASCQVTTCASWGTQAALFLEAGLFDFSRTYHTSSYDQGMAVSMWLRLAPGKSWGQIFAADQTTATTLTLDMAGALTVTSTNHFASVVVGGLSTIDFTQPNHLVFMKLERGSDSGWGWAVYVNGVLRDMQSGSGGYAVSTLVNSPRINANGSFIVDDVRGFATALTQAEIDALYNGGAGTPAVVAEEKTLFQYEFQEGAGNNAYNTYGSFPRVPLNDAWRWGILPEQLGPCASTPPHPMDLSTGETCERHEQCVSRQCSGICREDRRVFLTSTARSAGAIGGLAGADKECQRLADAAELGGRYKAWLSVGNSSPLTRFVPHFDEPTLPYVLVDGTIVAESWFAIVSASAFSPIMHAIDLTETGGAPPTSDDTCGEGVPTVFSNTYANGAVVRPDLDGLSCFGMTSNSGQADIGNINAGIRWSFGCSAVGACAVARPLYCFEQ